MVIDILTSKRDANRLGTGKVLRTGKNYKSPNYNREGVKGQDLATNIQPQTWSCNQPMPKAFSEQEKTTIRQHLREQGQKLFATHGLKKTSIDDLTKATGISKGAFYAFYPSKEELLLEILEEIELELQTRVLTHATSRDQDARSNVRQLLRDFLLMWDEYPLLKTFDQEEFMLLVRRLPPERIQGHADRDERFVNSFAEKLAREGISMQASPRMVTNLLKSLFLIGLHREELGEDAYTEVMDVLVDLVAGYVTTAVAE